MGIKQAFLHSRGDILLELPFFGTIIKVVQDQVTRWLAFIPIIVFNCAKEFPDFNTSI